MRTRLLVLAGTTEATALARDLADSGYDGVVSFAGRVERPVRHPLPQRIGGFGGVKGLVRYLADESITHVIDATHPFASQMSENAARAAAKAGVAHCVLTRKAWEPVAGDNWVGVPDIAGAVAALNRPRMRVMLAIGRMLVDDFAANPQHYYLLRFVDPPAAPLALPDTSVIVDRGPFDVESDRALMERHRIELVVSKNAGGGGAYAKIAAARALGLPVIMIDRPTPPSGKILNSPKAVIDWIPHASAHLGV